MPDDALTDLRELVQPALSGCDLELVDLHWDARTQPATLRLVIDGAAGVTLDDCERASTAVSAVLDARDPVTDAYLLEVSSPGAERPLRDAADWQRNVGRRVNVRFRNGDAETVVEGTLEAVDESSVVVRQPSRRRTPHPREVAAGASPTPPPGPATEIPVADVLAGRLAVEL